jgi:sugar lactone lactonase YvrE
MQRSRQHRADRRLPRSCDAKHNDDHGPNASSVAEDESCERWLNRLYVTTATENWSDEHRRATPSAGLVYRLNTEATGRPAIPFRPEPEWWSKV